MSFLFTNIEPCVHFDWALIYQIVVVAHFEQFDYELTLFVIFGRHLAAID